MRESREGTTEDVRAGYGRNFSDLAGDYLPDEDLLEEFDIWLDEFTGELRLKAYDQGFKNGVKCAEGAMRRRS